MLRIIFSFYNKYETFNRQAKQLFQYIFVQYTIDLIIIFILQILLYFHLVDTAYKTVAQLARGSGGGPPALFIKIVQTLVEKSALFVFIYGFNTHLKCSFKSISEKKHQNFSLWGLSFVCHTPNIYESGPIPRNLPCPEKPVVALL